MNERERLRKVCKSVNDKEIARSCHVNYPCTENVVFIFDLMLIFYKNKLIWRLLFKSTLEGNSGGGRKSWTLDETKN